MTFNTKIILTFLAACLSLGGAALSAAKDAIWIDVRTDKEWQAGHLESATHIPHTEIAGSIASLTEDKNAPIKLYCRSGGRAGKAKESLEELGYTNVENVGGLEDAQKAFAAAQIKKAQE